jgi:hypothetical protein
MVLSKRWHEYFLYNFLSENDIFKAFSELVNALFELEPLQVVFKV